MEPAVFSCIVFHGTYISNNQSVYQTLNSESQATFQVHNRCRKILICCRLKMKRSCFDQ